MRQTKWAAAAHHIRGDYSQSWLVFLLVLTLAFLFSVRVLHAQSQSGSPVTADVDRTTISTDETVTLNVTVLDTNASRPSLPILDGFQVRGSSYVSQQTIVNGVTTAEATYSFVLQPTRAGELTIPAITIEINGRQYTTDPITVQVSQGASAPPPSSPSGNAQKPGDLQSGSFFVEAEVDNDAPYLGQQVNYIFRFFQAETMFGTPRYIAPDYTGFWNQQEIQQSQYFTDRQNSTYRVTELRTILFPTVVGERTIEPGSLEFPGSLLRSGTVLQSNLVTLTVKAPPAPVPADFSGAVGSLSISATVEPGEVAVNEPVTLRVVLEGKGNIETLPDPTLPELSGWRAFESTSSISTEINDGVLAGTRIYEQLLVPAAAGEYQIPAVAYTYFDPETESYETANSAPIAVKVLNGAAEAPVPSVLGVEREAVEQIDNDIRFIKPAPGALAAASVPLTKKTAYWMFWLIPPFIVLVDWAWQRRKRIRDSNPAMVRRSLAARKARKALASARQQSVDPHEASGQILFEYLSDKLNKPVAGLTQAGLANLLRSQKIDESTVNQVCSLLSASEYGRFAPAGDNHDFAVDLIGDTEQLILNLEQMM